MRDTLTPGRTAAPPRRRFGSRRRRWLGLALAVVFVATAMVLSGGAWWIASLGPPPLGEGLAFSTLVVDRDGRLLRPYTTLDGRWRLPAGREQVDPRFLQLLLAYEDKRFGAHRGVDPLALGRAFTQLLGHRRIISGASTITMQVARLLEPRTERSLTAKLRQMVRALELEVTLSKDEILALYLSLAPYGGNLEGVRAASLAYFGKEPRRLTLGEAAMLVALPQSPEQRRPDRSADAARNARDRVLDRLGAAGVVPWDEIARAKHEPVPDGRKPMPMLAPHAADAVIAAAPDRSLHRLTIDAALQRNLEDLARERARALGSEISVAIVAVDHGSGEVLARVASADYFDTRRSGQVDMTAAVRSPGSTLKPFIYGLGFEDGLIHPDTLIEDRPIRYGNYAPENFDLTFQGTVTVRRALQLSLNVPAVAVLDKIGANRFAARLEQAGGSFALPEGEVPGLAIGLGGVGVKLTDLVALYAGLARLGTTVPLTERVANSVEAPSGRRLLESGCRLVCGQYPSRHAATGKRSRRPHRLQDRDFVRLSRRLGRGLRRQAYHRGLGRPPRRRAGTGPARAGRGGADPVRCLCAHRQAAGPAAAGAQRHARCGDGQAAAAPAAFPPRRSRGRECRAPAPHHVPSQRRPARACERWLRQA